MMPISVRDKKNNRRKRNAKKKKNKDRKEQGKTQPIVKGRELNDFVVRLS